MNEKIYLTITPFFPHGKHFAGSYIYDQIIAIKNNSDFKMKTILVCGINEKNYEQKFIYQGIECYMFKVFDIPSNILPGLFNNINQLRFISFIKNVMNIDIVNICKIHSHVIYPCGFLAYSLSRKFNVPYFIQHHGLDVYQNENGRILKGKIKNLNNKFKQKDFIRYVNNADLNICVSEKVLLKLKEDKFFKNEKSYILYNGVDHNKFYKIELPKNEKYIIGCIANFWTLKDQITLLKSLKILINEKISNLQLIFIGSGHTLNDCIDYVKNNKLESYVSFLSEIDHRDLNQFYNKLDLFVLPSYNEALGCVYMESLFVDKHIIAVKGQGIEEVLSDDIKEFCLIDKSNYIQLAEKIKYFYFNKNIDIKLNFDISINSLISTFLKKILNDY